MWVYRIEHKQSGAGPYVSNYYGEAIAYHFEDELSDVFEKHPTPWMEGLEFDSSMHCGFTSKKQMQDWFAPHHVKYFEENEYYVYKFFVRKKYVNEGCKQCVFRRDCALFSYRTTYH